MKKLLTFTLALFIAAGYGFAFTSLNPDSDKTFSKDIKILEDKKALNDKESAEKKQKAQKFSSSQNQQDSDYLEYIFLEGSYSKDKLIGQYPARYEQGPLDLTFYVKELQNGNTVISFKVLKKADFDDVDYNMEERYTRGEGSDPHAPVEIYAVITPLKNKEAIVKEPTKIHLLTIEAFELSSGPSQPEANNNYYSAAADGSCNHCGSADAYHCKSTGHTGPCDKTDKSIKAKTK